MTQLLIIDDSAYNRKLISKILASDGYELQEAENGRQALEMISNNPPEGILLDLIMPEMNGFELISILKERAINIPVIVITADIQKDTYQQCLGMGVYEVLNKPVDPDSLRNTLRQALGGQTT